MWWKRRGEIHPDESFVRRLSVWQLWWRDLFPGGKNGVQKHQGFWARGDCHHSPGAYDDSRAVCNGKHFHGQWDCGKGAHKLGETAEENERAAERGRITYWSECDHQKSGRRAAAACRDRKGVVQKCQGAYSGWTDLVVKWIGFGKSAAFDAWTEKAGDYLYYDLPQVKWDSGGLRLCDGDQGRENRGRICRGGGQGWREQNYQGDGGAWDWKQVSRAYAKDRGSDPWGFGLECRGCEGSRENALQKFRISCQSRRDRRVCRPYGSGQNGTDEISVRKEYGDLQRRKHKNKRQGSQDQFGQGSDQKQDRLCAGGQKGTGLESSRHDQKNGCLRESWHD